MTNTPTEASQAQLICVMEVLAEHALWIHVETGKQPTKCGCGYVFQLGESMVAHIAKAAIEQLDQYRQEHGIVPSYMELVYVYPEDDAGNGQGHVGIYNADATEKIAEVEGWHLFRFKDKDTTNDPR